MPPLEEFIPQDIPVIEVPFPIFYRKFEKVSQIIETKEWKEIYSYYYEFDKHELEIDIHEDIEDIEMYDPARQLIEQRKCINSFNYFCHKYIKITHPMLGLIPAINYKYQRRAFKESNDNRFTIVKKFRQGGLTTTKCLESLWKSEFRNDQRLMIISRTDNIAVESGKIIERALQYMPAWLKCRMNNKTVHEKSFLDTNSTLSIYGPEGARSRSISYLVVDEAAFIENMEEKWADLGPIIFTGGSCCVISTVNGVGNWYAKTYMDAENNLNPFKVIDLKFWENPEYNNPNWEKEALGILGPQRFNQEVLGLFIDSGDTYIDSSVIVALSKFVKNNIPERVCFDKWCNISKSDWDNGALWIWKEPKENHEYIMGVDCAEGVGKDNSCFQVLDSTTMEQVAEFYSNTVPPHIFAQIVSQIGLYYNNAIVIIENAAQGNAVLHILKHDVSYENLFYEDESKDSAGVKPKAQNRMLALQMLQSQLLSNTLKINSPRFVEELETLVFNPRTKKVAAQAGKHDDAIMSMCWALFVRDIYLRNMHLSTDIAQEIKKVVNSNIFEEIRREITNDDSFFLEEKADNPEYLPITFGNDQKKNFNIQNNDNNEILKEFGFI